MPSATSIYPEVLVPIVRSSPAMVKSPPIVAVPAVQMLDALKVVSSQVSPAAPPNAPPLLN